jgi:hypothetical protein
VTYTCAWPPKTPWPSGPGSNIAKNELPKEMIGRRLSQEEAKSILLLWVDAHVHGQQRTKHSSDQEEDEH